MNRTKLKNYAPQARSDFIQAMTDRAALYGLTAKRLEPVAERGDVAVIAGREHPRSVAKKRRQLEDRIQRHGFVPTMEAMAYTWFNRLVAIRFMELHGYLDHGYRVLSHPEGKPTPEILEHAEHVDLPGLKKEVVLDLKLAGNKESELYRLLLTAQCNALHSAMPFLFEKIDDETELLLPDNLLHSDSLIRKLVGEIDEDDWHEVEVIGWLYQFYISERKDEVIGKVVASEDIPAATQLFTPNWIVKYLVQNTLGRQWLATYPQSALRQQMDFYIEPAEQTPEVQEQLKAITPTSLNPEEMTLLDPACGSGHILVEAYDLFKAIYQERGYRAKDIPTLILQKNLFGLEIDERAAQLAAFALMMKARSDDRRIFDSKAKPTIVAIQDSKGSNAADITHALNAPILSEKLQPSGYLIEEIEDEDNPLFSKKVLAEKGHVSQADITSLLGLFEDAKTFGSLIQIPSTLAATLPDIEKRLDDVLNFGDLTHGSAHVLKPLLQQARLLARQYDAVVANPPFLDNKYHNKGVKSALKSTFRGYSKNLFSCFLIQGLRLTRDCGHLSFLTPFVWLFIDSYEQLRNAILDGTSIVCMVKPSYTAFFDMATVQFIAFTLQKHRCEVRGTFIDLGYLGSPDVQASRLRETLHAKQSANTHYCRPDDFRGLPGRPIAFWVGDSIRRAFNNPSLSEYAQAKIGMRTGDNERFVRRWYEVSHDRVGFGYASAAEARRSAKKWFPYNKGGNYRKWFGNNEYLVNWEDDGREIKDATKDKYPELGDELGWKISNEPYYFLPAITWSKISSYSFGARACDAGFLFDVGGSCIYPDEEYRNTITGLLCSKLCPLFMQALNPTVNMQVGNVSSLPFPAVKLSQSRPQLDTLVKRAIEIALIYAHSGNQGFDPGQYMVFRADDDGIIPLLETDWGIQQDATSRLVEFIGVAWPNQNLEENLKFIADSLSPNNGEQPRATIRRYFATGFYKHHLSMYKKRPIYWLFSSGKHRAFQCLVYLHRYHEGTLARMRTEYVIPLQGQVAGRIEQLEGDKAKASSTSHRRKLQKEQDNLKKQQAELVMFEEKLKHFADQKISLDLDDGVKVNYAKFGDLLAEAKAITGEKESD